MMHLDRFWELIEEARRKFQDSIGEEGYPQLSDCDALTDVLSTLSPAEIIEFKDRFDERMIAAYDWDLWAALYIIEGGGSADSFEHFRAELILCGQEAFEAALRDADSLADVTPVPVGIEGLIYVPSEVYEQKTGEPYPYEAHSDCPSYPDRPAGNPWEEKDLPKRLPRLWAEFGEDEVGVVEAPGAPSAPASPTGPCVRIVEGHFANHEGYLVEQDDATGLVTVMVTLFGRPTPVQLQKSQIEFAE